MGSSISRESGAILLTLADFLAPVHPHLPEELVGSASFNNLMRWGDALSGAFAQRAFGYECRLTDEDPFVDISIQAARGTLAHELLRGSPKPGLFLDQLPKEPIWCAIQSFATIWSEDPLFQRFIENLVFEFDTGSNQSTQPGIFLGFDQSTSRYEHGCFSGSDTTPIQLLEYSAELFDSPLHKTTLASLNHCFNAVDNAIIFSFAGLMVSRPNSPLKICMCFNNPEEMPAYLERIGLHETRKVMVEQFSPWLQYWDSFVLHLDFAPGLKPGVGVECMSSKSRYPTIEPRMRAFLNHLVSEGLCSPTKKQALERYSRAARVIFREDIVSKTNGKIRLPGLLLQSINHIKATLHPDTGVTAKAYLRSGYYWGHKRPSRVGGVPVTAAIPY